ncbi:hypothetical protein MRB53_009818 [Persea americana]|uniref:Uncharacterized protein n=1 Tax=Persea americana TaxID=3435 RepID=A0ACC2LQ62_PERAE|nr:hypothetical protein MRB53_009818 [Persea americana]
MYSSTAPGSKLNTTIQLNRELVLLYNRSGGSACCCTTGVEVLALSSSPRRRPEKATGRVWISRCREEIASDLWWAIAECKPEKSRRRQRSLSPSLQPCPSPEKETAAVTETLCFRAVP